MSVIGKTHRLWIARAIDSNELVALIHSMYDVPDDNHTPHVNVKYLVLKTLNIYGKRPWIEIRDNFVEAEWETWYGFKLVPVIKITKAGVDSPHRWEAMVE